MLQAGAIGLVGLGYNHLSMLQAAAGERDVSVIVPKAKAKSAAKSTK